jgi:hypothetical protein
MLPMGPSRSYSARRDAASKDRRSRSAAFFGLSTRLDRRRRPKVAEPGRWWPEDCGLSLVSEWSVPPTPYVRRCSRTSAHRRGSPSGISRHRPTQPQSRRFLPPLWQAWRRRTSRPSPPPPRQRFRLPARFPSPLRRLVLPRWPVRPLRPPQQPAPPHLAAPLRRFHRRVSQARSEHLRRRRARRVARAPDPAARVRKGRAAAAREPLPVRRPQAARRPPAVQRRLMAAEAARAKAKARAAAQPQFRPSQQ